MKPEEKDMRTRARAPTNIRVEFIIFRFIREPVILVVLTTVALLCCSSSMQQALFPTVVVSCVCCISAGMQKSFFTITSATQMVILTFSLEKVTPSSSHQYSTSMAYSYLSLASSLEVRSTNAINRFSCNPYPLWQAFSLYIIA